MNVKELVGGNATPITDILAQISTAESAMTALEVACLCKRAEQFLAGLGKQLRPQANKDFKVLQAQSPDLKKWDVGDNLAVVTQYSPRAQWTYPADLVQASEQAKGKLKASEIDGTATKVVPEVDPASGSLFSITVTK